MGKQIYYGLLSDKKSVFSLQSSVFRTEGLGYSKNSCVFSGIGLYFRDEKLYGA